MRNLLSILCVAALSSAAIAQTVVHVDPVRGIDHASCPGTQNDPVRTIGHALSMQQPGQAIRIRLERGRYYEEAWPMTIGADEVVIEAVTAGSVIVNGRRTSTATSNFLLSADSQGLCLRGFTLRSAPTTIEMSGAAASTDYTRIKMEEMILLVADRAISADVSGLTHIEIDIRLSNLHTQNTALDLIARENSHLKVNVQRSYLHGGSEDGIQMLAEGVNASIETNFENSVFSDFPQHAIRFEGQGGQCNLYVTHCNLLASGLDAIRVTTPTNNPWATYTVIRRNIFWGNATDFYDWPNMTHLVTWESNLVQDAGLANIGANHYGDPLFVDAGWVMRNDSPARSAAYPAYPFEDFNGTQRGKNGAMHDLGAIQHGEISVGLDSQIFLGREVHFQASGPPLMAFQIRLGSKITHLPFEHISGTTPHTRISNGSMDSSGAWRATYKISNHPSMAGRELFVQLLGRDAQHTFHASSIIPRRISIPPNR